MRLTDADLLNIKTITVKEQNMTNEIKLSQDRTLRVVGCGTSVDVYVFNANENEAVYHEAIDWDSCIEYTAAENIESIMEDVSANVELTNEDVKVLENALKIPVSAMSSDR